MCITAAIHHSLMQDASATTLTLQVRLSQKGNIPGYAEGGQHVILKIVEGGRCYGRETARFSSGGIRGGTRLNFRAGSV